MKFSYFIWDYDGTLFDTYDAVARAYHRAAQQNGIEIAFDELRWLTKHSLGWAAKQLEQRYGTAAQDILDAYYAFAPQEETLEAMRPYPGTRETLRAVCEHGGKNYLYSGYWKVYENVEETRKKFQLFAAVKQSLIQAVTDGMGIWGAVAQKVPQPV